MEGGRKEGSEGGVAHRRSLRHGIWLARCEGEEGSETVRKARSIFTFDAATEKKRERTSTSTRPPACSSSAAGRPFASSLSPSPHQPPPSAEHPQTRSSPRRRLRCPSWTRPLLQRQRDDDRATLRRTRRLRRRSLRGLGCGRRGSGRGWRRREGEKKKKKKREEERTRRGLRCR